MPARQTRIFVRATEPADWAATLAGTVLRPLVREFERELRWFWFSRYVAIGGARNEDRGDCDLEAIADDFKRPPPGIDQAAHRSLRFRYDVAEAEEARLEQRLRALIAAHGYAISDVRAYDSVADLGGERFLGAANRGPGRDVRRAALVAGFLHAVSLLAFDALVGPDGGGRYRLERNGFEQNPNGSTFESVHHLFANMTDVPLSVLVCPGADGQTLETFWGGVRGARARPWNGRDVSEVFLTY